MSDARIFPEGSGKSQEQVDEFLDELATGQHDVDRPPLNPIDDATVSDWEAEVAATSSSDGSSTATDQARDLAGQAANTAKDAAETAKGKASELSAEAQARVDEGVAKASSGLGQAAETLRQRSEEAPGAISAAAATAADQLDHASTYLREKDTDQLLQDIEALIRRKPVESLLVAAGAGFVLSKLLG